MLAKVDAASDNIYLKSIYQPLLKMLVKGRKLYKCYTLFRLEKDISSKILMLPYGTENNS